MSAVCGAIAAALLAILLEQSVDAAPIAILLTLPHALLLGLPIALVARRKGWTGWLAALVGGFAVGAIPLGLLTLFPMAEEASTGGVPTVVHHFRTAAGWLEYLASVLLLGVHGAVGGVAFWLALAAQGGPGVQTGEAAKRPRRWLGVLVAVVAAAAISAIFTIPTLKADRSCHNPLRNGARSIGAQISIDLAIDPADWPALRELFRGFAAERGWSFRDDIRHQRGLDAIYLSVCEARGTQIMAMQQLWEGRRDPLGRGVEVSVYQPQGGLSWQLPTAVLVARVAARWPDRVRFRDARGELTGPPEWLQRAQPVMPPHAGVR